MIRKGEQFDDVPRAGSECGSRPGEHRAVGTICSQRVIRGGNVLSDFGDVVGDDVGYGDTDVAGVGVEDCIGVVVHSSVRNCPGDIEGSARFDVGWRDNIDHDKGVFEVRRGVLREGRYGRKEEREGEDPEGA